MSALSILAYCLILIKVEENSPFYKCINLINPYLSRVRFVRSCRVSLASNVRSLDVSQKLVIGLYRIHIHY